MHVVAGYKQYVYVNITIYDLYKVCLHLYLTVMMMIFLINMPLFSLGTNRFEVTLEKSNKNFSKKIQQVCVLLHDEVVG